MSGNNFFSLSMFSRWTAKNPYYWYIGEQPTTCGRILQIENQGVRFPYHENVVRMCVIKTFLLLFLRAFCVFQRVYVSMCVCECICWWCDTLNLHFFPCIFSHCNWSHSKNSLSLKLQCESRKTMWSWFSFLFFTAHSSSVIQTIIFINIFCLLIWCDRIVPRWSVCGWFSVFDCWCSICSIKPFKYLEIYSPYTIFIMQ